ncbi:MAG: DUF924 family protein [Pseudomonadota bacterium]
MHAQDICRFWLEECTPEQWYRQDDALDATIAERFGKAVTDAQDGAFEDWLTGGEGALALLLLLDQFSRNIFRGSGQSFAGDARARAIAAKAIAADWDREIAGPGRQFFYLPHMHSEDLAEQDQCIAWFEARMPEASNNLLHARVHREIIARHGRFPYRNAALGRVSTPEEKEFLAEGGYGKILAEIEGR